MTPRSGDSFWSREEIADAMQKTAKAGFNTVFFNAWSRGWPLWQSEVFYGETGFRADPKLGNRDIFREAVAEAKKAGLDIEAWMEYGFVGWWDGQELKGHPKGPLFTRHPEWLARKQDGSDEYRSGHVGTFYWMAHSQSAVQRFMVALHAEIAARYEVTGIELDRIRYPRLDCGYDSVTVAMYRATHDGNEPPVEPADSAWMRWRADRLIEFHRSVYDSIKHVRPDVLVTNAPGHYSTDAGYSAYEQYLQDWRAWVREGSVDAVQVQMYGDPSELRKLIPSMMKGLKATLRYRLFAGIAVKPSENLFSREEVRELVSIVRGSGLDGYSVWFYNDLRDNDFLEYFGEVINKTKSISPFRGSDFR